MAQETRLRCLFGLGRIELHHADTGSTIAQSSVASFVLDENAPPVLQHVGFRLTRQRSPNGTQSSLTLSFPTGSRALSFEHVVGALGPGWHRTALPATSHPLPPTSKSDGNASVAYSLSDATQEGEMSLLFSPDAELAVALLTVTSPGEPVSRPTLAR
jgi:hypothetical protein